MIPWHNLKRFFLKAAKQPFYASGVFLKRINAQIYYTFGRGKSSYPESLTLFLTHRCNLRCQMCGQWGEGGVSKRQTLEYISRELNFEELKKVIDDVSGFNPSITLFGGEPLLYSHCLDLIRYIKQNKMHCLMITNGSLLKEMAGEIAQSGIDELNISLDGDEELHDKIRGLPGVFQRIMEGIDEINKFKASSKNKKPLINLQCTINKQNYQYLEQMLEVAERVGANSLTFHNLIFLNRGIIDKQKEFDKLLNCKSTDWEGFVFEPGIDPMALFNKIEKIRSGKYPFSVDAYPNFSCSQMKDYYGNPCYLPFSGKARCLSPWIVAYVFPDGEVRPCLNFTYSYGNIKEKSFRQVWNSAQAVKYRRMLKSKKIFPVCIRCTELYRY